MIYPQKNRLPTEDLISGISFEHPHKVDLGKTRETPPVITHVSVGMAWTLSFFEFYQTLQTAWPNELSEDVSPGGFEHDPLGICWRKNHPAFYKKKYSHFPRVLSLDLLPDE